jgi:hypothetical protein
MSDSVSSLLGSAGVDPKIRKKGNKFVVEGVGEFDTYEDAVKALDGKTGDKISGQGPTMVSGESAMDFGDEQSALDGSPEVVPSQPSAKAPNSSQTPNDKSQPKKPDWVAKSEKSLGIEYEYDPVKKTWRPKKGAGLMDKTNAPVSSPNTP